MEDKTFELMTKMYSDFSKKFENLDKKFENIDKKFENMDKRFDRIENDILRLENKQDNHSKALFDGYKLTYEKLLEHDKRFDVIETKLEKQDIEIRVIKGGKA